VLDLNGRKITLLCGDGGLKAQKLSDIAKNTNGEDIKYDGVSQTVLAAYPALFSVTRQEHVGRGVFWVDLWNEYVSAPGYGYDTYCHDSKRSLAATMDSSGPQRGSVIILCMENILAHNKQKQLGAIPEANQKISLYEPQSLTLYHELFHVQFKGEMFTGTNEICRYSNILLRQFTLTFEIDGVGKCLELGRSSGEDALKNPESFAYFALSMWYLNLNNEESRLHWSFHAAEAVAVS